MGLSKVSQQIESHLPERIAGIHWSRSIAAGTLAMSALLLLTGRRKTALGIAAAGTVVALLEDPESVRNFWNNIPDYVKNGQRLLARLENLVEQVAEQGSTFRDILRRA